MGRRAQKHTAGLVAIVARADREKVQQMLLKLLSNAVKFSEPGGRIWLECSTDNGGHVVISVSDAERGIAPDHIERAFQSFVQLDAKLTRAADGTGQS